MMLTNLAVYVMVCLCSSPVLKESSVLRSLNFRIRVECFSLPDIDGKSGKNVKFYTDVYDKKTVASPGAAAFAQLVKPGFKLDITGRFQTDETWYGMYKDVKEGSMKNIGYGVLESEN